MINETAKNLLAKSFDDLDFVIKNLDNARQRDNVGYHICMSVEKTLKAICEVGGIEYEKTGSDGHAIRTLFDRLTDAGAFWLNDYLDLLQIARFDSQSRYNYTDDVSTNLSGLHAMAFSLAQEVLRRLQSKGLIG